jgi:hypothetical protein
MVTSIIRLSKKLFRISPWRYFESLIICITGKPELWNFLEQYQVLSIGEIDGKGWNFNPFDFLLSSRTIHSPRLTPLEARGAPDSRPERGPDGPGQLAAPLLATAASHGFRRPRSPPPSVPEGRGGRGVRGSARRGRAPGGGRGGAAATVASTPAPLGAGAQEFHACGDYEEGMLKRIFKLYVLFPREVA